MAGWRRKEFSERQSEWRVEAQGIEKNLNSFDVLSAHLFSISQIIISILTEYHIEGEREKNNGENSWDGINKQRHLNKHKRIFSRGNENNQETVNKDVDVIQMRFPSSSQIPQTKPVLIDCWFLFSAKQICTKSV